MFCSLKRNVGAGGGAPGKILQFSLTKYPFLLRTNSAIKPSILLWKSVKTSENLVTFPNPAVAWGGKTSLQTG